MQFSRTVNIYPSRELSALRTLTLRYRLAYTPTVFTCQSGIIEVIMNVPGLRMINICSTLSYFSLSKVSYVRYLYVR